MTEAYHNLDHALKATCDCYVQVNKILPKWEDLLGFMKKKLIKGHHYLCGAEQLESAQEEHAASAKRSCNDKGVKVICICCK